MLIPFADALRQTQVRKGNARIRRGPQRGSRAGVALVCGPQASSLHSRKALKRTTFATQDALML